MATVAPSFTTRVGSQVVNYQSPDSLALRNWAQVRDDPRGRFKDSYNPVHRSAQSCASQHRYDLRGDDVIANAQVEQLQLEVVQARSEIQNLRSALHYAGLALQGVGNWDKLPPELRMHLEAHHRMVDELTHNLRERDQEVLEIKKKAAQSEALLKHQRHVLLKTVGSAFGAGPLLLAWTSWQKLMRQKDKEVAFQEAMKKCRGKMKPTVLRTLKDLASSEIVGLFRVIFQRWCIYAQALRHEADKKQHQQEHIKAMVQMWAGNRKGFGLRLCWSGWLAVLAEKDARAREEELRRKHLEEAKHAKKELLSGAALSLADSNDKQKKFMLLKMCFRSLLEHKTDSQIQKKVDEQAKINQEKENKRVEQQVLLLLSSDRKVLKAGAFAGWRDLWQTSVDKKKQFLLDVKRDIMHLWITVFKNGARAREIERMRKEENRKQEEEKRKEEAQRRQSLIQMTDWLMVSGNKNVGTDPLLLRLVLSAWKEDIALRKISAEKKLRQKEREEWEEQFEEEERRREQSARARLIAVNINAAETGSKQAKQFLLKMTWYAWKDVWKEEKRYNSLEYAQRVLEDDLRYARKEANELLAEKKALEARHHKAHEQRLAAFLFVQGKDNHTRNELLLRIVMSSWKECVEDFQQRVSQMKSDMKKTLPSALVKELQHEIEDELHLNHGCFYRWCRCCFCRCCRSRKRKKNIGKVASSHTKVHPAESEGHSSKETKRDNEASEKVNLVNLADPKKNHPEEAHAEKPERDSLAILTREEYNSYFAKIKLNGACFYTGTIILAALNVACLIYTIEDDLCAGQPLDWYVVFACCVPFDAFALCCAAYWFVGAANIANKDFYLASECRRRASEDEDQLEDYQQHLRIAFRRQARGLWISCVGNIALKIGMVLQIIWTCFILVGAIIVLRFPEHYWCNSWKAACWTSLFSYRLIWSFITLLLPNFLNPEMYLDLPLDIPGM